MQFEAPGTYILEDFEIGKTIGIGSFGQVRLVTLKEHPQTAFALKSLKKCELLRHNQVERAKAEKDILLFMDHPFIIRLFLTFQDVDSIHMALEYASGGDLFSRLEKEKRFSEEHARFYAAEAALALDHLHSMAIAHRDFKPENLLIDGNGHLKLADFGSAKIIEGYSFTQCSTPEYSAPEMIQSRGHSLPVDWWAFGVAIFEMIVGQSPFVSDCGDPFVIYQNVLAGRVVGHARTLTVDAANLVKGLLRYNPSKRYGCREEGIEEIKRHIWFSSLNWDDAIGKQFRAPFVPVASETQCCQLDSYDEPEDIQRIIIADSDQRLFESFG